jgi:hypothetical protein
VHRQEPSSERTHQAGERIVTSVGEILDLLAIDVIAVGMIVIAFAYFCRSVLREKPPCFVACVKTTWATARDRASQPKLFAFLLVSAAIAGSIMDLVADEILDGPLVHLVGFLEEDELKVEEFRKVSEAVSVQHAELLAREVAPTPGLGGFEDRVKSLFQNANAVIRVSENPDLLSYIRAETRVVKILRILFVGLLVTTVCLFIALWRYGWTDGGTQAFGSVAAREVGWPFLFGALVLCSLWLWTEQNQRLYKQVLHAYLAVSAGSAEEQGAAAEPGNKVLPATCESAPPLVLRCRDECGHLQIRSNNGQ